jgi:hypothetical protein
MGLVAGCPWISAPRQASTGQAARAAITRMRYARSGTRPGGLAVNSGATQAHRFSGKRICDTFRYACWDSAAMTALTTYTEWSEDLWSGVPPLQRVPPCPPAPPERPFIPGAIAAGQPIRSFADLDRASDDDLSPRLRDLRDDVRGLSKRTGRPYPPAFRQFRVIGAWGCYERRLPPPPDDPWLPAIEAFLADKAFATSTEIWLNGCPPVGRRRAFRRIASIMRFLGWRRWRTDFVGVFVRPGLATPKRAELMRLTGYIGGGQQNSAAPQQPRAARRRGSHLQDLDRREAVLAGWAEEGGTAMTTQAPSAGQQQDCGEATGALRRERPITPLSPDAGCAAPTYPRRAGKGPDTS